jgi:hypothetical protein
MQSYRERGKGGRVIDSKHGWLPFHLRIPLFATNSQHDSNINYYISPIHNISNRKLLELESMLLSLLQNLVTKISRPKWSSIKI